MTAYHETGHLMVTYMKAPSKSVFKASIIPRRGTLGVVWSPEREELHSKNKEQLLAEIMIAFGGYAAERVKFNTTTSGVSSDFTKAMQLAHVMVWSLGMGDSGYVGDYTAIPKEELSEEVKVALNKDTNVLIQQCIKEAEKTLEMNRPILDRFAKELLEREELEYDEIIAIFAEYGHKESEEKQWIPSAENKQDSDTKK